MTLEVLANLEEYLVYMQELGFHGLALDTNPFLAKVARKSVSPQKVFAPPKKGTFKKQEVPAKPLDQPALFNVKALLNLTAPPLASDNKSIALQVKGENSDEVLRNLYQAFHKCSACALGTTRTHFVFGEGPSNAKLMFVGEGPGADEDQTGRPFVGKAGQLLSRIIEAMGFKRSEVFITNIVKCRPPGNRTPLPDEMATCSPILDRQIEAVNPDIIIALGATALRFFKNGEPVSITRLRGQFFKWKDSFVMPTFHPAYILRNPRSKRNVWDDMQKVLAHLKDGSS